MELKLSSQPLITVRTAYDLNPSITISTTLILTVLVDSNCGKLCERDLQCLFTAEPFRDVSPTDRTSCWSDGTLHPLHLLILSVSKFEDPDIVTRLCEWLSGSF